jgi:peptidyl-prolyl cis-trans isomerase SurA
VVNPATKQAVGFRIVKLVSKEPAGQRDLSDPRVQQAGSQRTPGSHRNEH